MKLKLERFYSTNEATLGSLSINDKFECYTLEDEYREKKVHSETRIPAGTYQIKLQMHGTMTGKYAKRFPEIHEGMLWLQDVPNFTTIYIHIGNTDDDTSGCILVGSTYSKENMRISASTVAYLKLYPKVVEALKREDVFIEIDDLDRKAGTNSNTN